MGFKTTYNDISVISFWSVLLMEDPEKTTDLLQATDKHVSNAPIYKRLTTIVDRYSTESA